MSSPRYIRTEKYSEAQDILRVPAHSELFSEKLKLFPLGRGKNKIQGVAKQKQTNRPFPQEYGGLYG